MRRVLVAEDEDETEEMPSMVRGPTKPIRRHKTMSLWLMGAIFMSIAVSGSFGSQSKNFGIGANDVDDTGLIDDEFVRSSRSAQQQPMIYQDSLSGILGLKPEQAWERDTRNNNEDHLLRFNKRGLHFSLSGADHLGRFARAKEAAAPRRGDEHLLRFNRAQQEEHLLRFNKRGSIDDHLLRYNRSPQTNVYQLLSNFEPVRQNRGTEDHLLRFNKRSGWDSINDDHLLRYNRADGQDAGRESARQSRGGDEHLLRFNKRAGDEHLLRFNRDFDDHLLRSARAPEELDDQRGQAFQKRNNNNNNDAHMLRFSKRPYLLRMSRSPDMLRFARSDNDDLGPRNVRQEAHWLRFN